MSDRQQFELHPIGEDPASQAARGWRLEVNGEPVPDVTSMRLVNDAMGVELAYGQRRYFDAPHIHEQLGGGSFVIPYAVVDKQILVGGVLQERELAGGVIFNIPRGFANPGATHDETAVSEVHEETGLQAVMRRFVKLGSGINPNTAFFDTSGTTPEGDPEGAAVYAIRVLPDELEAYERDGGGTAYRFREDLRAMGDDTPEARTIVGSMFIPFNEAMANSPDAYTAVAAGFLANHLMMMGELALTGVQRPAAPE